MPEWLGLAHWDFNNTVIGHGHHGLLLGILARAETHLSHSAQWWWDEGKVCPWLFCHNYILGQWEEGQGDRAVAAGDFGVDRNLATHLVIHPSAGGAQRRGTSSGPWTTIWTWGALI